MKVSWLNEDLTEAVIVRGWIWKRQALVRWKEALPAAPSLEGPDRYSRWIFCASGTDLDSMDSMRLNEAQIDERRRQQIALDWQPVSSKRTPRLVLLPPAREVRR